MLIVANYEGYKVTDNNGNYLAGPFSGPEDAEKWIKYKVEKSAIKPDHYQSGQGDVISFCQQHGINFSRGNVIKYVTRAGKKDPDKELEDLEKAREYLDREIEKIKADQK